MFKRRKPQPILTRIGEAFWPRGGWGRAAQYIGHRINRIPDTPHRIAAGLATGAAISFTPFLGFHILISLALCYLIRGNLIAAAFGTLVGNPVSFPLIWALAYQTGLFLLGGGDSAGLENILLSGDIWTDPLTALQPILWPLSLGSVPWVMLVWAACYWPLKAVVARAKSERIGRIRRKRQQESTTEKSA